MSPPVPRPGAVDPFALLGVARTSSVADIRAARRRLAFDVHPDRGGDGAQMQAVNAAFEAAIAHATGRRRLPDPGRAAGPADVGPRAARPARTPGRARRAAAAPGWRVEHDAPSFTIDALPVEAFEALLVVTSWIGEVALDEPPYLLEVHLFEPADCWCRLELVPDAGSSTVSLSVAATGDGPGSPVEAVAPVEPVSLVERVRDTWVAHLNALGEPPP